ncbi:thioesterase family protein [Oceanobacillus sp. J11TS1]|uniref:acyl-CoA thioesterase n=1 Tax=Oceanobacillus sp. J11TS1 TaxID=2807191 RepID=UPI001B29680F|nr:thioesterase family protein [Oceanobacillus sp. J11TS1]GIO24150.1 thioesterase [Oceanobacillus sp. J11TS1]
MEAEKQIVVEEKDIDGLHHVNNSVYLNYLEHGREAWYIKHAGYSYEDFPKANLGTVVLKISILYKKEALLHDVLRVITKPNNLGNTSFVFEQKILNDKEELVCEAIVTKVMIDFTTRKSRPVIEEIAGPFRAALDKN